MVRRQRDVPGVVWHVSTPPSQNGASYDNRRDRSDWAGGADRPPDAAEAAVRVIIDPGTWGRHHDLTGPRLLDWPAAMRLLSAELGEEVTFATATEQDLLARLTGADVPPFQAELLIVREWALLAGENERITTGISDLTGHQPRTVEDSLHENRDLFR